MRAARARLEPQRRARGQRQVFDAAFRRSGTVRVKTYTQLFAAARMLASSRFPEGERLAIVTNAAARRRRGR